MFGGPYAQAALIVSDVMADVGFAGTHVCISWGGVVTQAVLRGQMGVLDRIGQGGQGVVYRAPGVRTAFAKSMVYKEYKKATLASLDVDALRAMPDFLESLAYRDGAELIGMAAWPCRVVEDGGVTTGFVMPAIPDEFFCDFWTSNAVAPSKVMAEFQHLLNDPQIVAARLGGVGVSERQKFEVLRAAASALSFLHERGVWVGDISPKNLLFSLSPVPAVYFVDCDAMRVNGVSLSHQVETPGWGVPAGEQKATVYSDRYKLGLLALRLLVGDQDVRDPARLPGAVPSWLRTVITETLTGAPEQRPMLGVWEAALDQAIPTASRQAPTAARVAPSPPPPPPPPRPPVAATPPPVVVIGPPSTQGSPSSAPGGMTKSAQGKAVWLVVPALVIGGMLLKSALDNNTTTTPTTTTVTAAPPRTATETRTETATQTAVQTITQTVPSTTARQSATALPSTNSVWSGVIVGTCDEGGSCGVKQRTAPYVNAPRLVSTDLQDGMTAPVICLATGDLRSSTGHGTSNIWYRLVNGAYVSSVYIDITAPASEIPPC